MSIGDTHTTALSSFSLGLQSDPLKASSILCFAGPADKVDSTEAKGEGNSGVATNACLVYYGLPQNGTVAQKRVRLGHHVGNYINCCGVCIFVYVVLVYAYANDLSW